MEERKEIISYWINGKNRILIEQLNECNYNFGFEQYLDGFEGKLSTDFFYSKEELIEILEGVAKELKNIPSKKHVKSKGR